MAIDKIVSKVTSFLEKARTPVIPIPAVILACSLFKRPGALKKPSGPSVSEIS